MLPATGQLWTFEMARVVDAHRRGAPHPAHAALAQHWSKADVDAHKIALVPPIEQEHAQGTVRYRHFTVDRLGPDNYAAVRSLADNSISLIGNSRTFNQADRFAQWLKKDRTVSLGLFVRSKFADPLLAAALVIDHQHETIRIINVEVHTSCRGRGLAQALLFAALFGVHCGLDKPLHYHDLELEVDVHSTTSRLQGLYARFGFAFDPTERSPDARPYLVGKRSATRAAQGQRAQIECSPPANVKSDRRRICG